MAANDDGGSVLALHEVLMAELLDATQLGQDDESDVAEYKELAAKADALRHEKDAVVSAQNSKPEAKDAACRRCQDAEMACLVPVTRMLHRRKRSALCFSGGGIRSATFSLGILQALARHSLPAASDGSAPKPRLLAEFDFLSTVSGGGYIGSWFSSWLRREGMDKVLPELASRPTDKLDPGAKPILYLRNYTNYLSPRLGLFSGDTWTLVATTVRNMLLNWFVLLPFLAAALLIPVLFNLALGHPPPMYYGRFLLPAGFLLGVLGTTSLLHNLPSFGNARLSEKNFVLWCLTPLMASAICLSLWWCWLDHASVLRISKKDFAIFGAAIHFFGVLFGSVVSVMTGSPNFSKAHIKPVRLAFACVAAVLTGALGSWLVSLVASDVHPQTPEQRIYFACFAVPLILATLMAVGVFSVGVSSKVTDDDDREWWSRAGGWVLIATIGWLVFFSQVLLLPMAVALLAAKGKAILGALTAAIGWYVTEGGKQSDSRPSEGPQVSSPPSLTDRIQSWLLPLAAVLFLVALALSLVFLNGFLAERLHRFTPYATALLLVIEVAFAIVASYGVNVNKFSLHAMYRMRLIRAYLGASSPERKPNPFTGFDPDDDAGLATLRPEKPLHVLNLCLNLVRGEKLAWQQRKAESFTMTRLHSGSLRVGYQSSVTYGHGESDKGLSLGTAMAISGAAASPNMGYHSSPLTAIVMTLFNARLGWWLANPGDAGKRFWNRDGPAFGIKPFLDEALGNTDDENRYVYLSDGGHFENLGIYEMALRRCKYIVAVDAGGDPEYTKEDLGNAVRKIRIDLGIPIEFPAGVQIDKELGAKGKRCAIGRVRYDLIDEGAEEGTLLYIKPVMVSGEPADVQNYWSVSKAFPQEPTSDQWFNESQFESYRSLGAFTMDEIIGMRGALSIPELFGLAKVYLNVPDDDEGGGEDGPGTGVGAAA